MSSPRAVQLAINTHRTIRLGRNKSGTWGEEPGDTITIEHWANQDEWLFTQRKANGTLVHTAILLPSEVAETVETNLEYGWTITKQAAAEVLSLVLDEISVNADHSDVHTSADIAADIVSRLAMAYGLTSAS
jgi:hypothetical protein